MDIEVLDACALIAYLKGEPGGLAVELVLDNPGRQCYVHAINFCKVYYQIIKIAGETTAQFALGRIFAAGSIIRSDMDEGFWKSVGQFKSRGRISLADCFCLALAIRLGGRVVTSDHGEFDPLVPLGLCPIFFIR